MYRNPHSNFILIFSIFYAAICFGQKDGLEVTAKQQVIALLEKSQKAYDGTTSFTFNMDYKLFTTYNSNTVSETYSGIFIKRKQDSYSRIGKTEFVHLDNDLIKIDNESGLIQFSKNQGLVNQAYNLKQMVSHFSVFELASEGNYWVCTLTGPEITFVPYGKVVAYIHKTDFTFSRQVLYLLKANAYKDKNGTLKRSYPRLEIRFSDYTTHPTYDPSVFRKDNYIREFQKRYVPAKKYAKYKIVD